MKLRALLTGTVLAVLGFSEAGSQGTLWMEPGAMTLDHWRCGSGGCGQAPLAPFQFQKENQAGTNSKVTVTDAKGRTWNVKFGAEVIPECFASRFVTAIGYLAEPSYYVGSGKMEGVKELHRARRFINPDGTFARARFQARGQKDFVFLEGKSWAWDAGPFRGTRELAGLKILMMLLSNWDAKDSRDREESNNGVFRVEDHGRQELFYGVFDWGASLGRWGDVLRRDQSDCVGYSGDTPQFMKGVRGDTVEWGFRGKHGADLATGITVSDVRWLLPYLERITPDELRAGLKASGATDRQTACWSSAIQERIGQLRAIVK